MLQYLLPFPISTPILESSRRSARPQLRVISLRTGKNGRTSHRRLLSSSSSSWTAAWFTHSNMWPSISPSKEKRGYTCACFHSIYKGMTGMTKTETRFIISTGTWELQSTKPDICNISIPCIILKEIRTLLCVTKKQKK